MPLADKIAPRLIFGAISNVFMQELHHGDQEKVPQKLLEDFKTAFENAKHRRRWNSQNIINYYIVKYFY